jgi:hypothetical protein
MLQDVTTNLDLGHDINETIGFIETKFPDILLNVRGDNAKASPHDITLENYSLTFHGWYRKRRNAVDRLKRKKYTPTARNLCLASQLRTVSVSIIAWLILQPSESQLQGNR